MIVAVTQRPSVQVKLPAARRSEAQPRRPGLAALNSDGAAATVRPSRVTVTMTVSRVPGPHLAAAVPALPAASALASLQVSAAARGPPGPAQAGRSGSEGPV